MLRSLAIAVTTAGVLAGLPSTSAQACDDDRFPCPLVSETQETADAPRRLAPSPQPRKKAGRAARRNEKAPAKVEPTKVEREAARVPAPTNAVAPAVQEQAADTGSHKEPAATPALRLNEEVDRNESPVAAAAAAWLVLPKTDGAGAQAGADVDTTPADPADEPQANGVQLVDPNEVNELDLAAVPAPAEISWLSYLLMTLGAALAAASTVRFFLV
jgi:hypothetical protein